MTSDDPPLQRLISVLVMAGKEFYRSLIINRLREHCSILPDFPQSHTNMPHSCKFTAKKRRIILNTWKAGPDIPNNALAVGRSREAVYNIRNNPTNLCASPCSGRPPTVSDSRFRQMMRTDRLGLEAVSLTEAASSCLLSERRNVGFATT